MVHEAVHRGIRILRDAGKLPFKLDHRRDELAVRALMQRHFGDLEAFESQGVEHPQITQSRWEFSEAELDQLEKAAADFIAKKRPMGPR
jgi:hypothetical protein